MFSLLWRKLTERKIGKIILHCSATKPSMDIGVETIRRWHKQRGFNDIGYHYVIRRDGCIELGRPLDKVGAHTKYHNRGSIGICLVGGVKEGDISIPRDNFTPKQWKALRTLLTALHTDYPKATIHGHNEFAKKACPSFNVRHELESGRLVGLV